MGRARGGIKALTTNSSFDAVVGRRHGSTRQDTALAFDSMTPAQLQQVLETGNHANPDTFLRSAFSWLKANPAPQRPALKFGESAAEQERRNPAYKTYQRAETEHLSCRKGIASVLAAQEVSAHDAQLLPLLQSFGVQENLDRVRTGASADTSELLAHSDELLDGDLAGAQTEAVRLQRRMLAGAVAREIRSQGETVFASYPQYPQWQRQFGQRRWLPDRPLHEAVGFGLLDALDEHMKTDAKPDPAALLERALTLHASV